MYLPMSSSVFLEGLISWGSWLHIPREYRKQWGHHAWARQLDQNHQQGRASPWVVLTCPSYLPLVFLMYLYFCSLFSPPHRFLSLLEHYHLEWSITQNLWLEHIFLSGHPSIHSFLNIYWLSVYYMPGTTLSMEKTESRKSRSCLKEFYYSRGEKTSKLW